MCLTAVSAMAQNPIIRDQFSADPTARVFNNKVYLYPSHDIMPPAGARQDWFCMEDYHVFSSLFKSIQSCQCCTESYGRK